MGWTYYWVPSGFPCSVAELASGPLARCLCGQDWVVVGSGWLVYSNQEWLWLDTERQVGREVHILVVLHSFYRLCCWHVLFRRHPSHFPMCPIRCVQYVQNAPSHTDNLMLRPLVCSGYPRLVIETSARHGQLLFKNDWGKITYD